MGEADDLNATLEKHRSILRLLSDLGKRRFFPKQGILSQTAQAKGAAINATVGQAFDDDGGPLLLDVLASQSTLPRTSFLYSPSFGQARLREVWLKRIQEKNPSLQTKTTLPIVTAGLTHGLSTVKRLFVDDGDVIISPDKFWGNYRLIFDNATFDTFPLFDDGFNFDEGFNFGEGFNVAGLAAKLATPGTKKIVLLNFPNNPTGYTPTDEEAQRIVDVIHHAAQEGKDIGVICDDAYFNLIYEEGIFKESIFAKLADLHENVLAIKIDGASKEKYAWGLRVGFVTLASKGMADEVALVLEDKIAGDVRATISNVSTAAQLQLITALESSDLAAQKQANYEVLKHRYDVIKETLANPKYSDVFEPLPFNSGYFMCVRLKNHDANAIRLKLIEKGIGLIAIGDLLRVAFSGIPAAKIPDVFEQIYLACQEQLS